MSNVHRTDPVMSGAALWILATLGNLATCAYLIRVLMVRRRV